MAFVQRQFIMRRRVLLGLLSTTFLACAICFAQVASAGSSSNASRYSQRQVTRAFHKAGINFYDLGYEQVNPVTTLATPKPLHGFSIGVYIYGKTSLAEASFKGNAPRWRASGMAAAQVKNVIVTVVPQGRSLKRAAHAWPMPGIVAKALKLLTHGSSA